MTYQVKSPRKLIEVALPLDVVNAACAHEKSIRHGHPSTLHLWWARRPLAAARAVLFAQLVNDPGYQQGGGFRYGRNKKDAAVERERLFKIMEALVRWENNSNEEILKQARVEILRSWREVCDLNKEHPDAATLFNPESMPGLHDPFAGGGGIPFEAQRLGLNAHASDLNPVAVLINKAMIEIPGRFFGRSPVGPESGKKSRKLAVGYLGATGLAEDVRRYGFWVRTEAVNRIGQLYPKIRVSEAMAEGRPELTKYVGKELTVAAWLWARTVKSPNPAFSGVSVPLVSTFMLSTKSGKEVFAEPVIEGGGYRFAIRSGKPSDPTIKNGTKLSRGANFQCVMSRTPIESDYIQGEGKAGRIGARLMAMVADGTRERVYLPATHEMETIAANARPEWKPDVEFFQQALGFRIGNYGMSTWSELYTPRQLVALSTLCDLIQEARTRAIDDAIAAGFSDDNIGLAAGGNGAVAYGDAISVYLSFALSKLLDRCCTLVTWFPERDSTYHVFGRHALPMTWDFAETNVLDTGTGSFLNAVTWEAEVVEAFTFHAQGTAVQIGAQDQSLSNGKIISTDPPYYDNIGYADLSDFFYVWLRKPLQRVYPELFATLSVPKADELVATPARHGGKEKAEAFFLQGMGRAMHNLAEQAHPAFPVTIYYAFRQSETDGLDGTVSTGWEVFLDAVLQAGFAITGTWPMRTENATRLRGQTSNALASSIVLVCEKRRATAQTVSRRDFLRELNAALPEALDEMTNGSGDGRSPVAPVDLAQSIIGPGMAVFSKYSAVLEADGTSMSVRTALQLINRFLAEDDFDADTQFCLRWFEQYRWDRGPFGDAETLSRAKGTSVEGVKEAGVIAAGGGNVRLLKWSEYPTDWDPIKDSRNPVWETLHHLVRAIKTSGESAAGRLLAATRGKAEAVRQLAYRLFTLCDRKNWADDARVYNELITSWSGIEAAATAGAPSFQGDLFERVGSV